MADAASYLSQYRKLIAALAGLLALYVQRRTGVAIAGVEPALAELLMSAGTALAVWWLPNRPASGDGGRTGAIDSGG